MKIHFTTTTESRLFHMLDHVDLSIFYFQEHMLQPIEQLKQFSKSKFSPH
jgi:hypothetical protein